MADPGYPAVDDVRCGHIDTEVQNALLENCVMINQALGILNTRFINAGYQHGECRELLSHIVCPLIWHLVAALNPDTPINPHWLTYGSPAGSGLDGWATFRCTVTKSVTKRAALYADPIWAQIVEAFSTHAPEFGPWLLEVMTTKNSDEAPGACYKDDLLDALSALAAPTPSAAPAAEGGRRTRRKQRKNRRTRRARR
jgi:hypothetical protein